MTAVLIPWRPAPDRQAAWDRVRPQWLALGWPILMGTCPDGPWLKALAVEDALSRADADVLVVADADVWCEQVPAAVAAVRAGATWAVPHARILRLSPAGGLERPPHAAVPGGGITVIRRTAYLACPMPRLARAEDEAWGVALTKQFGRPWRGLGDLIHYWHEPAGGGDG